MGKVLSVIPRKMQRFNIENRAHRIIEKEKPTPAPKHPGTQEFVERFIREHPEIVEDEAKKNVALDERLKQVYLVSHDPKVPERAQSTRPLPLNRTTPEFPEFGFQEPNTVPKGKITLRQAVKFIGDHQTDPKTWTADKIAEEYLISKESAENIVKYFHTFEVYLPPTKGGKVIRIAQPSSTKKLEGPET